MSVMPVQPVVHYGKRGTPHGVGNRPHICSADAALPNRSCASPACTTFAGLPGN